jgi:hypothetical protein
MMKSESVKKSKSRNEYRELALSFTLLALLLISAI